MANDINKFICTGRVGKIELRYTKNNMAIADVSIAIGSYKKNGDEFENITDWANLRAFDRLAERLGKLGKGEKLAVEGYFKQDEWKDKDGTTKYRQYFVIDKFEVLSKPDNAQEDNQQSSQPKEQPKQNEPPVDFDDDIPF